MDLMWNVYVIQSEAPRYDRRGNARPGFYYVGCTTDVFRRLREHNGLHANGKRGNQRGGRYTSRHRPWVIRAIYGPYENRSEAQKAERALKRGKRGPSRAKWDVSDSKWCRGLGDQDSRIPKFNKSIRKLQVLAGT